jgi:parallel beta-helix repeat protein
VFYPGGGGHSGTKVFNNRIINSGTGGGSSYAFEVGDTVGGVFTDNEITHDTSVAGNGQLVELGKSANNTYRNNRYQGNSFAGLSISPRSRQYGTVGNGVKKHPDR